MHPDTLTSCAAQMPNPRTDLDRLEELARRGISARLLSVSYPLAPEHPFPEGRDTTEDDVLWLLEHSGSTPVVVGARGPQSLQ